MSVPVTALPAALLRMSVSCIMISKIYSVCGDKNIAKMQYIFSLVQNKISWKWTKVGAMRIRVIWSTGLLVFWLAGFMAVDVVYAEESAGKGGDFSEANQEGFMDLSFRVNEDATEEKNEASEGKDGSGDELDV